MNSPIDDIKQAAYLSGYAASSWEPFALAVQAAARAAFARETLVCI